MTDDNAAHSTMNATPAAGGLMPIELASTRHLADLLHEFGALLDKAASHGLEIRRGRWSYYIKTIRRMALLERTRGTAQLVAPIDMEEAFEACAQLLQLQFAAGAWDALDSKVLRKKLAIVSRGATIAVTADKPRDSLLELVAVALAKASGFVPELTDADEDIRVPLPNGDRFAIECTRPSTVRAIETAARHLGGQLAGRLAAGAKFGIPIVGIDRLVAAEGLHEAATMTDLWLGMRARRKAWIRAVRTELARRLDAPAVVPFGIVVLSGAALAHAPESAIVPYLSFESFPEEPARLPSVLEPLHKWPENILLKQRPR